MKKLLVATGIVLAAVLVAASVVAIREYADHDHWIDDLDDDEA